MTTPDDPDRIKELEAQLYDLRTAWAYREPQLYAAERKVEVLRSELFAAKQATAKLVIDLQFIADDADCGVTWIKRQLRSAIHAAKIPTQ